MDAIWDRLELASGQKGVPGGVHKKSKIIYNTFFILKFNKQLLLQKDQLRIQQKLFHKPILQKEYLELLVNLTTFLHPKNLLVPNIHLFSILKD